MAGTERAAIFATLRHSLGREGDDEAAAARVEARLTGGGRNIVPQRGQLPPDDRRALFMRLAGELSASVDLVADGSGVPGAIAGYLARENLPAELRLAPDDALRRLPWWNWPLLQISEGKARPSDLVSVTGAFAAIAETGTLMLISGPPAPTTLNFLPDTHIVVLWADGILPAMEDGFDRLRAARGRGAMPRTVNLISGPSRSADIEQMLQLGAHGPRRLHIVVVDGAVPAG